MSFRFDRESRGRHRRAASVNSDNEHVNRRCYTTQPNNASVALTFLTLTRKFSIHTLVHTAHILARQVFSKTSPGNLLPTSPFAFQAAISWTCSCFDDNGRDSIELSRTLVRTAIAPVNAPIGAYRHWTVAF